MFGFFENKKEDSEAYKRGQEEEKMLKEDTVTKIPVGPSLDKEEQSTIEDEAEFVENTDSNTGKGLGTSAN